MKKYLFTLLAGLALGPAALAQQKITLNAGDYPQTPPNDRLKQVVNMNPLAYLMTGVDSATWDLFALNYGTTINLDRDATTLTDFPGATYRQFETRRFGNIVFPTTPYFLRDGAALGIMGETIGPYTVALDTVTGSRNDQLVVPSQQSAYSGGNQIVLQFPTTYGSGWSSTVNFFTNLELTVAAAGYNQQPVQCVTTRTVDASVIGWGKVRVKDPVSLRPTIYMDVLQVKVVEITNNTYNSAGMAVDPLVLRALNLDDNRTDTVSHIWLMRKGETTPLLDIIYDGLPSVLPRTALLHQNRLQIATAVDDVTLAGNHVKIYPNPVQQGNNLFVECDVTGNWQLRLSSLTGQQLADIRWHRTQTGAETVPLPGHLAPGIYLIQLFNEGGPVKTQRLVVRE